MSVKSSDSEINNNASENSESRAISCRIRTLCENDKCSLILPVYLSHKSRPDKKVLVYALLDSQSDSTFVLDKTLSTLGIEGVPIKFRLSTMLSIDTVVDSTKVSGLIVRGFGQSESIELPASYTREIMPANRQHIPTPSKVKNWPHLSSLEKELQPELNCDVGLLIGYNCPRAISAKRTLEPPRDSTGPYGQLTRLGWGVVGITNPDVDVHNISSSCYILSYEASSHMGHKPDHRSAFVFRTTVKEVVTPSKLANILERDFEDIERQNRDPYSQEDIQFLSIMKNRIKLENKHYVMPLPLKNDILPELPNNRSIALFRLKKLKSKFISNERYFNEYKEFMNKLLVNNYAEKVPVDELMISSGKLPSKHG